MARGILVPRPGIEPIPPKVETWSLNHWTAREVPELHVKLHLSPLPPCHWASFAQMSSYLLPSHCSTLPLCSDYPCSTGLRLSGSSAPESRCCGSEASPADSALGSIRPGGAPRLQAFTVPTVPERGGRARP